MNSNDKRKFGNANKDKWQKASKPDDSASYNQGDIATKEEFADLSKHFGYEPTWSVKKIVSHLTKSLVRSRLPEPDASDFERRVIFSLWADRSAYIRQYLINSGMSRSKLKSELRKRFGCLEKRYNEYYHQRFANIKVVYRGISVKELYNIRKKSWEKYTRDKPDRKWADVSTNKTVAHDYASIAVFDDGIGVILEIDKESIKDKLVSPGYKVDQLDRPKDDINAPDHLFRLPHLEEHHMRPDVDLWEANMKITFIGERSKRMRYIKEYKNINPNWAVE